MNEDSELICKEVCLYCGFSDVNVLYLDGYYFCFLCYIYIAVEGE